MKRLILITLLVIVIGCSNTNYNVKCYDGFSVTSYFPKNKTNNLISEQSLIDVIKIKHGMYIAFTPNEIKNSRVAFYGVDCKNQVEYYININDRLKKTSKNNFQKFINSYNLSCNGCLDVYNVGCC